MPLYDLHCTDCNRDFNIKASVADKMEKRILCPECGSNILDTIYKSVNIQIKNDASTICPNSHICGGGCNLH